MDIKLIIRYHALSKKMFKYFTLALETSFAAFSKVLIFISDGSNSTYKKIERITSLLVNIQSRKLIVEKKIKKTKTATKGSEYKNLMKIPFVVVLKVVERERLSSNVCQKVTKERVGLQNYKIVTEKGGSLDTVINKV